MTDKEELLTIIKTLLAENKDAPLLLKIRDAIQKTKHFKIESFERKLHDLILIYLKNNDPVVKTCILNLLRLCLSKQLFKSESSVDLVNLIMDTLQSDINDVEDQEHWLKAFDVLLLSDSLLKQIVEVRFLQIIRVFHVGLTSKTTSSLQKLKALVILNALFQNQDKKLTCDFLPEMYVEIIRIMFNSENINLRNEAINLGYNVLPDLSKGIHNQWQKIYVDFKEIYIPAMADYVIQGDCVFSKLWIFLTKLFGTKLHKLSLMMNPLLTIVENAFKSQNFFIRKEAFHCWQALIENYSLEPNEMYTSKRLKLLTIPLKTNNCKTEELIVVKFNTWCKLINHLSERIDDYAKGILDLFLNFCFGHLCDTPLASCTQQIPAAPGKKYPALYLLTSRAFLQLIGQPQYIDVELSESLNTFTFRGPLVSSRTFIELSKVFVFATGECCVLLNELEQSQEHSAINIALWKSLFYYVDSCESSSDRKRMQEEIITVILALHALTNIKTKLFNFGLTPIMDLILSKEFKFLQDETMWSSLFMPMVGLPVKKDWDSFRTEYAALCTNIFMYKRGHADNLLAIEATVKMLFTYLKDDCTVNKVNMLKILWMVLKKELQIELEKNKVNQTDEDKYMAVCGQFLMWPLTYLHTLDTKDIVEAWEEMYNVFCTCTANKVQSKVRNELLVHIYAVLKQKPLLPGVEHFLYCIVKNIKYLEYSAEHCDDVCNLFNTLRDILTLPSMSRNVIDVFQLCVGHLFEYCCQSAYLPKIVTQLITCLEGIITLYGKTDVLESVKIFVTKVNYSEEIKSELEKLIKIMKKIKDPLTSDQIKNIISAVNEKLKQSANIVGDCMVPINKCETVIEEQPPVTLLGHNPDTMMPVKLRSGMLKSALPQESCAVNNITTQQTSVQDDFIFVNYPYKFDPKKLPKHQREKLSRRRDDIPALYQDLSVSHSSNMFDSNSGSVINADTIVDEDKNQIASACPSNEVLNPVENDALDVIVNIEKKKRKLIMDSVADGSKKSVASFNAAKEDCVNPLENIASDVIPGKENGKKRRKLGIDSVAAEDTKKLTSCNPSNEDTVNNQLIDGTLGKENEKKRKKLSSLEKELQRIKIDCNDSGEYKNIAAKRRTRSLYSNYTTNAVDQSDAKILRNKNTTDTVSETKMNQQKANNVSMGPFPSGEPLQCNEFIEHKLDGVPERTSRNAVPRITATKFVGDEAKPGELIVFTDGTEKVDIIKGPEKSSPFKIVDQYSKQQHKRITDSLCREFTFSSADDKSATDNNLSKNIESASTFQEMDDSILPPLFLCISPDKITVKDKVLDVKNETQNMETESITSEILAEINEQTRQTTESSVNKGVCREVLLDDSSCGNTEGKLQPLNSPVKSDRNGILSSPVNNDTPTRNKELLKDTLAISPIKVMPVKYKDEMNETSSTFLDSEQLPSTNPCANEEVKELINSSPEMFTSQEYCCSRYYEMTETAEETRAASTKNTNVETIPINMKPKRNYLGGRSAHMMNLISAKSTLKTHPVRKRKSSSKHIAIDMYSAQSQNRTKKMMEKLEVYSRNKESEKETEEDCISEEHFIQFNRILPPPTAEPTRSILKKRKYPDCPDESLPVCPKRRKVNFSDPPVTAEMYVPKAESRFLRSVIHYGDEVEARPTTAKESEEQKSTVTDDSKHVQADDSKSTVADENESAKTVESTQIATDDESMHSLANLQEPPAEELPICPQLVDCAVSITTILHNLTSFHLTKALKSSLTLKGITTIGDLAKLTETQIHEVRIKVDRARKAFKKYIEQNSAMEKKIIRKVKPITVCCKNVTENVKRRKASNPTEAPSKKVKLSSINKNENSVTPSMSTNAQQPEELSAPILNSKSDNLITFPKRKRSKRGTAVSPDIYKNTQGEGSRVSAECPKINVLNVEIRGIKIRSILKEIVKKDLDRRQIFKKLAKGIPSSLLMELVPHREIAKYSAKVCNLSDIINEFDMQAIYSFLHELNATSKIHLKLNFVDVLSQLYSVIVENPMKQSLIGSLSTVQISSLIVERNNENPSIDMFVKKLYDGLCSRRLDNNDLPSPLVDENVSASATVAGSPRQNSPDETLLQCLSQIEHGRISKEVLLTAHRVISRQLTIHELIQAHYEEIREKV